MQYAIKDNQRIEAIESGAIASCICCGVPVRAYIKRLRNVSHWKHVNAEMCDKWWESEGPWHREWKKHFPVEWHEHVMKNEVTGEKHVADIFTKGRTKEIVIEFQNSPIKPEELRSREEFYKEMIWIFNSETYEFSIHREDFKKQIEKKLNELKGKQQKIQASFDLNKSKIETLKSTVKTLREKLNSSSSENNSAIMSKIIATKERILEIEDYELEDDIYNDFDDDEDGFNKFYFGNKNNISLKEKIIFLESYSKKIPEIPKGTFRYSLGKKSKILETASTHVFIDKGNTLYLLKFKEGYAKPYDRTAFVRHYLK